MICDNCSKENFKSVLYCEHCGERLFRAKIRLVDQAGSDNTLYIFKHDYIIGRDPQSEIYIDDRTISRKHARLFYQDNAFFIENYGSKNGIIVNSEQVEHSRLKNYDIIQVGGAVLHFYFSEGDFPEDQIHSRTSEFLRETLLKISREIQSKNMLDEVLNAILDAIVAITNVKDAMLWLPDETGEWQARLSRNKQASTEDDAIVAESREMINKVVSSCKHCVDFNGNKQKYMLDLHEIVNKSYHTLAISLSSTKLSDDETGPSKVLGVIILHSMQNGRSLNKRTVELMGSLMSQAVMAIENNYLYSEAIEKKKMNNELALAEKIQNRLLPRNLPNTPKTDLAVFSRAQGYVGGDYYDVLPVADEAIAIAIADIAGKGIGAALVMSSLQGSLRAQISYEKRPEYIVAHINQLIRECTAENLFATFFFCLYEYDKRIIKYVNAGHNPPILIKKDASVELLKSSATALGILEENRGQEKSIQLEPGEVIVFYTDGVTETMNPKMNALGIQALREHLVSYVEKEPKAKAEQILKSILDLIEKHKDGQQQHDDLTILILKVLAD